MVLKLRDLKKSFPTDNGLFRLIDIPELGVAKGDQMVIMGESGSGKTTLLNLISGIISSDSGSILINGTEITKLKESKRDKFRAANIGYIFQTFNLLQAFTALENVMLGMTFANNKHHARQRASAILERVGLDHRLNYRPAQLSVGEQQRVSIARALINRPSLILADEPTANLDVKNRDIIIELIKEVCNEGNYSLIIVTHEAPVAERFAIVKDMDDLNKKEEQSL